MTLPNTGPELTTRDIDAELSVLFDPVTVALTQRRPVVALGLWQSIHSVTLLPFHGYLGRTSFHDFLPIHPRFGIISFRPEGERALDIPMYESTEAHEFRRQHRIRRAGSHSRDRDDLTPADWEQGLDRRPGRFRNLALPAASFIQILNPASQGPSARRRRPALGRLARLGPKPSCLLHTRGEVSPEAAQRLAAVDLLLVDVQGLRGASRVQGIRRVLALRGLTRSTLVVAAGPSDLVPLWNDEVIQAAHFAPIGQPLTTPTTTMRVVGRDRLEAEREFEFAFGGLSENAEDYKLLTLAKSSWWASRQQLTAGQAAPETKRFLAAFETLEAEDPGKAKMIRLGKELLERQANDATVQTERREAVVEVALSAGGSGGLLVLTRNRPAADALRADLSAAGWSEADLNALGVAVRPPSWNLDGRVDTAVATGFFGPATLDCALASRARHLYVVADPIEIRALWFSIATVMSILERAHATDSYTALLEIRDSIQRHVPAFASDLVVGLSFDENVARAQSVNLSLDPVAYGQVAILLADGTRLEVNENARFEVLNASALRLKTAPARELRRGDEIIVLDDDSRAEFSDRLLAAVDAGALSSVAAARRNWFHLIVATRAERPIRTRDLIGKMKSSGYEVSAGTIGSWLPRDGVGEPMVPDTVDKFLAFAAALEIPLPAPTLIELHGRIARWRDGHRKCGRSLARAIRGAYMGRLDAPSLARIGRDWGMDAKQLMQAAQLATVEGVLKADGTHVTN